VVSLVIIDGAATTRKMGSPNELGDTPAWGPNEEFPHDPSDPLSKESPDSLMEMLFATTDSLVLIGMPEIGVRTLTVVQLELSHSRSHQVTILLARTGDRKFAIC
jgi:hypothetical protein